MSLGGGAATRFLDPMGDRATAPTIERFIRAPRDGTIRNLQVQHLTAGAVGNTFTYRLRVEAVDTALTASLAGPATQAADNVDTVAVLRGDRLSVSAVRTAAGGSPTGIDVTMELA